MPSGRLPSRFNESEAIVEEIAGIKKYCQLVLSKLRAMRMFTTRSLSKLRFFRTRNASNGM